MKKSIYMFGAIAMLVGSVAIAQTSQGIGQEQKAIKACSAVTTKITSRIKYFNVNRNKHVDNYIAAKSKIVGLVDKLEAKGYDVSKVRTDLVQYDALLKAFADSYSLYITDLTATQNYACGKNEGEFRSQLLAARTQLRAVRTADQAVKSFFRETLKPDLQALKEQIRTRESATEGGTR